MTTLEQLRAIEDFLDAAHARGDTLEEARRSVSFKILGHELHELYPGQNEDFIIGQALDFYRLGGTTK